MYATRTRKVKTDRRDARALAEACLLGYHSRSALGAFHRRLKARLGAPKAITATAHKLACLIYRMLRFGTDYVDRGQDYYERRYQGRVVSNLMRRAQELGYTLTMNHSPATPSPAAPCGSYLEEGNISTLRRPPPRVATSPLT